MTEDKARGADAASVKAFVPAPHEAGVWHCSYQVDKYNDGVVDGNPDDVLVGEGNLLTDLGVRAMLNLLALNAGTAFTTGANAHVAAGDAVVAAVDSDNALGNRLEDRHVATAVVTDQSVAFAATFGAGHATGDWEEVGVFNSLAAGDMLNHIVSSLGTKAAGAAWVLTITITIS